jgi:hypothetical protein
MATVTLDEARKAVSEEARKRNYKIVEQMPSMIADLAKEKMLYIFNVGPQGWPRSLGSLGNFYVPGCAEGEEVSKPLKIPGMILERVAIDMDKMSNRYENGIDVANDILYIGRGYTPDLNRERWGLFISETPKASKEQINQAKGELRKTCAKLIEAADVLERANKRDQIGDQARWAARYLGVAKVWLSDAEPREAGNCPACQAMIDIESVKCPKCSAVLDWERAKEFYPSEYNAYILANPAK